MYRIPAFETTNGKRFTDALQAAREAIRLSPGNPKIKPVTEGDPVPGTAPVAETKPAEADPAPVAETKPAEADPAPVEETKPAEAVPAPEARPVKKPVAKKAPAKK